MDPLEEPPRDRGGKFIESAGAAKREQELTQSTPKGPAK